MLSVFHTGESLVPKRVLHQKINHTKLILAFMTK